MQYSSYEITRAAVMKVDVPVHFTYPDSSSPCVAIKMGQPVAGGTGPDRDIVAFSVLCTHMGSVVLYEPATRAFKCPCHFSIFDPEHQGQMVSGQATADLTQIPLRYDPVSDLITAIGVHGLIYGRVTNTL